MADLPILFGKSIPESQVSPPYGTFTHPVTGSIIMTSGFMEPEGHGFKSTDRRAIFADGQLTKPLMIELIKIELIKVESLPWLVLKRQLAVRNQPAASGTLTVQTLQVLDAQTMPANVQLLMGMAPQGRERA